MLSYISTLYLLVGRGSCEYYKTHARNSIAVELLPAGRVADDTQATLATLVGDADALPLATTMNDKPERD